MNAAFQYVQQNRGIDSFASYPYTGTNGTCKYSSSNSVGYNTAYQTVESKNETALQQAVALIGPISVGIDAGQPSFQLYRGGVYSSPKCSQVNLDHAVLAVGYGNTSDGKAYWLLKNSWGTSWGIQGYMMMARNDNNMCGIATDASFPLTFIASTNQEYQASNSSKMFCHFHLIAGVLLMLKLLTHLLV
jgi:cathepsin L